MNVFFYFGVAAGVVALDRASKWLALAHLSDGAIDVLPFLQLGLAFNRGASFGFLHDAGGWQVGFLIAVAVAASVWLAAWIVSAHRDNPRLALALCLILGGALGNLIDRAWYQYVIDFISLYYADWRFPSFNLADAAITCGAAVFIFDAFARGDARK